MKLIPIIFCFALLGTAAAQQKPEYLAHFDPANGFKASQTNLTNIFLQLAGSLEATGSPEGYIRHMQAEHRRVSALYTAKTGKPHKGRMPDHLTDDYIDLTIKNWNTLAPPLKLDGFAREIGRCSREGIMGTRLTGTLAVEIFNEHQAQVAGRMSGTSTQDAGFAELRNRLQHDLEYGNPIDTAGYETTRRDAVSYAAVIADRFQRMSDQIDAIAKPAKAGQLKSLIAGVFLDLGRLAQSELELGILESALKQM